MYEVVVAGASKRRGDGGGSHWEKELDHERLASELASPSHSHGHEEVAAVRKVA